MFQLLNQIGCDILIVYIFVALSDWKCVPSTEILMAIRILHSVTDITARQRCSFSRLERRASIVVPITFEDEQKHSTLFELLLPHRLDGICQ
jgi:hypothetical protein